MVLEKRLPLPFVCKEKVLEARDLLRLLPAEGTPVDRRRCCVLTAKPLPRLRGKVIRDRLPDRVGANEVDPSQARKLATQETHDPLVDGCRITAVDQFGQPRKLVPVDLES